jgi:hypothetical protein
MIIEFMTHTAWSESIEPKQGSWKMCGICFLRDKETDLETHKNLLW